MEHLPKSGVLLCPNHSSNWDPILVALRLPINYRLHIMAKEELFRYPLLGWLLSKVGAFPVSRGNNDVQSVKTAIQAIKAGDNHADLPEGTVIRNGIGCVDGLPPHAKGGVAVIGVRTGATLVPVFVDGEKKLFPSGPASSSESRMSRYIPVVMAPRRRCRRSPMTCWRQPMPWAVRL